MIYRYSSKLFTLQVKFTVPASEIEAGQRIVNIVGSIFSAPWCGVLYAAAIHRPSGTLTADTNKNEVKSEISH
jgi:hypothetical protein